MKILLTPTILILFVSICIGQYNFGIEMEEYDVKIKGKLNLSTVGSSVIIGDNAGMNDRSFAPNVYIGLNAGMSSVTNVSNTIIGAYAGMRNSTNQNTLIGSEAGRNTFSGNAFANTFVGHASGITNESGSSNVFIGQFSGGGLKHGKSNVCIGNSAGPESSGIYFNGDHNIYIGYRAGDGINADQSNRLVIESGNQDNPLIYGEFDNDLLKVNGTLHVTETAKLEPRTTVPSACTTASEYGLMYYDSSSSPNKLRLCTDVGWRNLN
jgi:hypothetical protein